MFLSAKEKARRNQSNLINHHQPLEKPIKNFRFRFCGIIDKSIEVLKVMNQKIFPVHYSKSFFNQVIKFGPKYNYFAILNDITVGCLCTKVVKNNVLYIMTIGVLEPYRRMGIGSRLIRKLPDIIANHNAKIIEEGGSKGKMIKKIQLHVLVTNQVAIDFYTNQGYKIVETIKDYYKDLEIRDAHIFEKIIPKKK